MRRHLALWSHSLGISFHLEYARCSLAWDEAYRGRERLTVTVTRYRNARNALCYINFGLRPQGEVNRKEDRRIPRETTATAHASGRKWKEIIIPRRAVRKYAGCLGYAPVRGALRSFYCDIFSLPAVASFFCTGKVERTCSPVNTGREERDRVKLVSTSCGSFLAQDRICMETNRLLLRLARERVSWCKLHDYIIF